MTDKPVYIGFNSTEKIKSDMEAIAKKQRRSLSALLNILMEAEIARSTSESSK